MAYIYWTKGADDSLWRRGASKPEGPPDEILTRDGWEPTLPMDGGTWLTNTVRIQPDEARRIARELGRPTEGIE